MIIEFELSPANGYEAKLIKSFCEYIVSNMQNDIYKEIDIERFNLFESELLRASWVIWIRKPTSLDMSKLLKILINNLTCASRQRNKYQLHFKNIPVPGTRNNIDSFVRFLDKGNEVSPPTYVFSKVFRDYRTNLSTYWQEFVFAKIGEFPKSVLYIM